MKQRSNTGGCVKVARCVAEERLHADRSIVAAIGIVVKCINTVGGVEIADGIAGEGIDTRGGVLMASRVSEQDAESFCGVRVAGSVVKGV